MFRELRIVVRSLLKSRGFTFSALLVIALCIGANTAIFSVVNGVLWRPLNFKNPDRLVLIKEKLGNFTPDAWPPSTPDYLFFASTAKSFDSISAYTTREWELSGTDRPERITGLRVTPNLFSTLGTGPQLGRVFTDAEDRDKAHVAVLSDACWRRSFGGNPRIVGQTIYLDRVPYTVIGVMPHSFVFPLAQHGFNGTPADVYAPMSFTNFELTGFGYMFNKNVIARLRPGVTLQQARSETSSVFRRFESHYPPDFGAGTRGHFSGVVDFYKDEVVGGLQRGLLVLLSAIGFVLLIGCANLANLLLARSVQRRREFAVRVALGARQRDLVRQTLLESFCISFVGGALGLLIANWLLPLLIGMSPVDMPRVTDIAIDGRTLLFTLSICCLLPFVFGMFPAIETGRVEIAPSLRETSRSSTTSVRQRNWMSFAVITQYALSLVLLIGAGLLLRSFLKLAQVDPGFRTQRILAITLKLPTSSYKTTSSILDFYRNLINDTARLPGVQAVGAISDLPLSPSDQWGVAYEGKSTNQVPSTVLISWTAGDAMKVLGFKLISGRLLSSADTQHSPKVLVINETLARRVWPGENAVGKRMHLGGPPKDAKEWSTVVGIIADVRQGLNNVDTRPQAFQTQEQAPSEAISNDSFMGLRGMSLVLRTDLAPKALSAEVRSVIAQQDSALPIEKVQTLDDYVSGSIHAQRYDTYLVGLFAALALVLTVIGIGGVLLYSVVQRTNELGIRMALGGARRDIARGVLEHGFRLAGIGIVVGAIGAAGVARFISGLLYQTSVLDWPTLICVPLAMLLTTLVASMIPVLRAVRIDPAVALRE
jgi:putative ABC transport system permease protein